jgi:hypothetical protein
MFELYTITGPFPGLFHEHGRDVTGTSLLKLTFRSPTSTSFEKTSDCSSALTCMHTLPSLFLKCCFNNVWHTNEIT